MVDRIRQLIQARQLSPTQFADAIGVARPIVSHILGGRNKPSLEVVQKIIAAFPDIALPWLLSGQGDMLGIPAAASKAPEPAPAAAAATTPRTPARRNSRSTEQPNEPAEHLQPLAAPATVISDAVATAPAPLVESSQPLPTPVAAPLTAPIATAPILDPAIAPLLTHSKKSIRRVLIFYSDGTFADFSPSQDAL